MARTPESQRGKADLRCNGCGHLFRDWVSYGEILSKAKPGQASWRPAPPGDDTTCPECGSHRISVDQPRTVARSPLD